jgi:hypothetical protein
LKEKIVDCGLRYLIEKQGKKGGEIRYSSLEMAEYLQPINSTLAIEQKREMFDVKKQDD